MLELRNVVDGTLLDYPYLSHMGPSVPDEQLRFALESINDPLYGTDFATDQVRLVYPTWQYHAPEVDSDSLSGTLALHALDYSDETPSSSTYQLNLSFVKEEVEESGPTLLVLDGLDERQPEDSAFKLKFSLPFANIQIGKSSLFDHLRSFLRKRIATLETQVQAQCNSAGSLFPQPTAQELLAGFEFIQAESFVSGIQTCPIAAFIDLDSEYVSRHLRRLFSNGVLDKAKSALRLVNKLRTILLHALEGVHQFLPAAVTQRSTFVIHGFHPPAPSRFRMVTLLWRECSVSAK